MTKKTIRELKIGEFFKLKETDTSPVWVRQAYNKTTQRFDAFKYYDVNHWSTFSGNTVVYVDFTF